jgi:restriction system protein
MRGELVVSIYNKESYVRQEELDIIINQIKKKPYGKFMIYGEAGIGKTTLLNMLGRELRAQGLNVRPTQRIFNVSGPRWLSENYHDTVYLIDGLDEARYHTHLAKEISNQNVCCVYTSRKSDVGTEFDFRMELKGLSIDEMLYLVRIRLGSYKIDEEKVISLITKVQKDNFSPAIIVAAINQVLKSHDLKEDFFLDVPEGFGQSYVRGEGIDLISPEIILPKRSSIKTPSEMVKDIKIVNSALLTDIAQRPNILHSLTSRQFEEVVCELFEREGYNVELTKQTHDGGKDLIVLSKSLLGEMVIYAECKKFASNRPVNVGLVRELYGVVEADRATAGILVTSSYFSPEARSFRWPIKSRMSLVDYSELIRVIQSITN